MFGSSPEAERERLKFSDNLAQGELFKPWKPFKHPQSGDIEIGGWVKMSSRLPHPFMLPDLVHRKAEKTSKSVTLQQHGKGKACTGFGSVHDAD